MQNDKFWNEVLRKKVEEYVAADSVFSQIKTDVNKQVEEALIKLLKSFKEDVFREVEREYHREDVVTKIKDLFSEKEAEFFSGLPIKIIHLIVDDWQNVLEDSDRFWENYWDPLEYILTETSYLGGLEDYSDEELQQYKTYLINWFQSHNEGAPACIGEFFDWEACKDENEPEEDINKLKEKQ